jgi:hypothetical protein
MDEQIRGIHWSSEEIALAGFDGVVDLSLLDAPARDALYQLEREGECMLVPLNHDFLGLIVLDPDGAEVV